MSLQLHTDNQNLIVSASGAITASYALFAATASYAISSSLQITSSNQSTASLAVTASYAQTASAANYLFVGNNLTVSQTGSLGMVVIGSDPGQSNMLRVGGSVLVSNQIELSNAATQSMNMQHPSIYGTGNTGGAYPYTATGHLVLEPKSGSADVVIIGKSQLAWATDNSADIGYSGTHRPRTIYVASSSVVGTDLGTFDVMRVSGSANFSGPVTASAFSGTVNGNVIGSASYASTASAAAPSFVVGTDNSSSIDPNTYSLRINNGAKIIGPIESWLNSNNATGIALETVAATASVEFRASDGSKRFTMSGSFAGSTSGDRLYVGPIGVRNAFVVDGFGHIGIGNINPQFNLDVSGSINATNTSSFAYNVVSSSTIINNLKVSGSVQVGTAPTNTYAYNADGSGYTGVFRGLWSNGSATFTITSPAGLADIVLSNGAATGMLVFGTVGTNRWQIDTSGVFEPNVDNTYDLGRTTLRPRNLRIASASVVGTDLATFDVMRVSGSANFSGPVTASAFTGDGTQIVNIVSSSFASSSYTTLTASYSKTSSAATSITFVPATASYANTASAANNFFISGTQTIIGSILINNFTASLVDITITGSLVQTGSQNIVGVVTASAFSGSIQSASFASMSYTSLTASNATTASYTLVAQSVLTTVSSASYALTSSAATSITFIPATASFTISSSVASSSYSTLSSSWASTASAANTFFVGNALTVVGSATIQTIPIGLDPGKDTGTIAMGLGVLTTNINGIRNIGIGWSTLLNNTRGSNIVAIGWSAASNNTVGNGIVSIGYSNLLNNLSGSNIVSIGQSALGANQSGSNIVAIGFEALLNATGSGNVAIGNLAGLYEPGSNTFYLDNQDRGGLLASRTGSLFYGIFNSNVLSQILNINANTNITGTLAVNGQGNFSGQMTANGYAFTTDAPSGIFSIATNRIGAYTNGSVVVEFDGTSGKRIRFYGINPVNTPHIAHNDNLSYGFLLAENAAPSFSAIVNGGESMRWSTTGILISSSITPFIDSTTNIGSSTARFLTGSFAYITGTYAGAGAGILGITTSSYSNTASVGSPNFFVSGATTHIGSVLINNFTASAVDVIITGSLVQTGSQTIVGAVTASAFSGSIQSASFASMSYTTVTSSYAITAQSVLGTITSASYSITSSFANTFFPIITQSLNISGAISQSYNYGATTFTDSFPYDMAISASNANVGMRIQNIASTPGANGAFIEANASGTRGRIGATPTTINIGSFSNVDLVFVVNSVPQWAIRSGTINLELIGDGSGSIGNATNNRPLNIFAKNNISASTFSGNGANILGVISSSYTTIAATSSYLSGSQIILETMPVNAMADGMFTTKTAGEALVFGDVVFFATDSKVWKAHATGTLTYPVLGMAAASMSAGTSGKILLSGNARLDTWAWSTGSAVYLATSSKGQMTTLQPNGTGHVIQVLGFCHPSSSMVYFNPSRDYITHV